MERGRKKKSGLLCTGGMGKCGSAAARGWKGGRGVSFESLRCVVLFPVVPVSPVCPVRPVGVLSSWAFRSLAARSSDLVTRTRAEAERASQATQDSARLHTGWRLVVSIDASGQ